MTYLTNRAGEFSLYLIEDVTINFKVATDNFHSIRHLKCNNCILSPKLSEYNTISAFQLPTFLVVYQKLKVHLSISEFLLNKKFHSNNFLLDQKLCKNSNYFFSIFRLLLSSLILFLMISLAIRIF